MQPGYVTHKVEWEVGGEGKPLLKKKARRKRQAGKQSTRPTSREVRSGCVPPIKLVLQLPCVLLLCDVHWTACSTPVGGAVSADNAVLPPPVCGSLLNRFSSFPFHLFFSFVPVLR